MDGALERYGDRVPEIAQQVALIEDRQALELACVAMDLLAAARA